MPTTLDELAASIDKLPDEVTAALKETAYGYAVKVRNRAHDLLLQKTHRTGRTARAIRILDESKQKQWYVQSPGYAEDPANLPMWLEYGTRYMTKKDHLRPAADEIVDAYQRDMVKAATAVAARLLE